MYIALDFDETCVTSGVDIPGAVDALLRITSSGHKLCLWTCRHPKGVEEAISWFARHRIPLSGTNRWEGSGVFPSPKIIADLYIDDRGVGAPLVDIGGKTLVIDWPAIILSFETAGLLLPALLPTGKRL